ncbi:hypothetical protein BJ741DRAFT_606129 [Chytriomyces cf. hyalinus JEL632]|nr:hypothetical protein BJ741DRAFT_606129 [Chytriomyces cf. hyalinus JEL632]
MDFSGLEALALVAANASLTPQFNDHQQQQPAALPSFSRFVAKLSPPPPHKTPPHLDQPDPLPETRRTNCLPWQVGSEHVAMSATPIHLHVRSDGQATQTDLKSNIRFKNLVDSPVCLLAPDARIVDLQKDSFACASLTTSPASSSSLPTTNAAESQSISHQIASYEDHLYSTRRDSATSHTSMDSISNRFTASNLVGRNNRSAEAQNRWDQDSVQNAQVFPQQGEPQNPWNVPHAHPEYQNSLGYASPLPIPQPQQALLDTLDQHHTTQQHDLAQIRLQEHHSQQLPFNPQQTVPRRHSSEQNLLQNPKKQSNTTASKKTATISKTLNSLTTARGTIRKRETARRYRLNKSQVTCLTHLFNLDPNPSSGTHGRVATVTGMPRKAVRLWFQNARAKLRREARTAGFQDPATPYELRKYQMYHQQQLLLNGGKSSPVAEVVAPVCSGLYRSYEIPNMVLRGIKEIAEDVTATLNDYVKGAFGSVPHAAGWPLRAGSGQMAEDDGGDETEVDEEETRSGEEMSEASME